MGNKFCKICGMEIMSEELFGTNKDGGKNEDFCIYCYKDGENIKYCQSCAMPMPSSDSELFATNKDGSKNEEFCIYCYENGEYRNPNMTMSEMSDICVGHLKAEGMEEDEARGMINSVLVHLKRWK